MSKTTTSCRTNADRQKAAVREIEAALARLDKAHKHLSTPDGDLPFAHQVFEAISTLRHSVDRLRQYAENGW